MGSPRTPTWAAKKRPPSKRAERDAKLIPLWEEARRTLRSFDRWSADHVPRAQNAAADALANEAIDRVAAGGPTSVVRRPGTGAGGGTSGAG